MADATHTSYPATDRSYYALLKREIRTRTQEAGFSEQKLNELDLILAEMTSNLQKHAKDGEILAGIFQDSINPYIELICIDSGPGMADIPRMMADGISTANTLGQGLGSIKRFSNDFDIYSLKDWGTIVLSRIYKTTPVKAQKPGIEARPVIVAKPGETVSGDGYYFKKNGNRIKFLVCDGLGHGPHANEAMNTAIGYFKSCPYESPVEILRYLHKDIRKTRGMVAVAGVFDLAAKKLLMGGVGNIAVKLFHQEGVHKNHISYNGIVGHNIPNSMNDEVLNYTDYQLLVICSDGIQTRWDISKFPGIGKCDGTIIAAAIYKDFSRRKDDTSVILFKLK